jgi:hypothetical protein
MKLSKDVLALNPDLAELSDARPAGSRRKKHSNPGERISALQAACERYGWCCLMSDGREWWFCKPSAGAETAHYDSYDALLDAMYRGDLGSAPGFAERDRR